jgi:hypothetical protein
MQNGNKIGVTATITDRRVTAAMDLAAIGRLSPI